MPSPRKVALAKNDKSKFKQQSGYDFQAGCPTECVQGKYKERGTGGSSGGEKPKKEKSDG